MKTKLILLSSMSLLLSCGGGDGVSTGSVTVNLSYPSQGRAEANTSSVRVWVLSPLQEELSCAQLISEGTEPFAVRDFARLSDVVFNVADTPAPFIIDDVPDQGRVLVYAEVTDYVGTTILAGCDDLPALGDASLTLIKPRTFDCADAATPEGAACDDGLLCTSGEECSSGSCGGGTPISCAFLEDQCNGSVCSEDLGCQPVPAPEGTNCDDGSACTAGDQCDDSGSCTPGPIDCSGEDRGICVIGACDFELQVCEAIDSDSTAATTDDECSLQANIEPTDCYELVDGDECNDSTGRCNITTKAVPPVLCTNQCITDGTCSGTICTLGTGTAVDTPEEATETTCNDSRDNDCDNLIDCADSDCSASPDCAF